MKLRWTWSFNRKLIGKCFINHYFAFKKSFLDLVLYCRGQNSSAFDEKGVFFSFFYIFAHFSPFAVILCVSVTNLSLPLCFSSNLRAHHKNYGKWWKIDKNVEKDEKFTFFVKIGGIRSPTIQLFVKIGFLFNSGKYWLKTVKSGFDIW